MSSVLELAVQGNRTAMHRVYEKERKLLYFLCLRLSANETEAAEHFCASLSMIWEDAAPRDAVSSEAFRLLVTRAVASCCPQEPAREEPPESIWSLSLSPEDSAEDLLAAVIDRLPYRSSSISSGSDFSTPSAPHTCRISMRIISCEIRMVLGPKRSCRRRASVVFPLPEFPLRMISFAICLSPFAWCMKGCPGSKVRRAQKSGTAAKGCCKTAASNRNIQKPASQGSGKRSF